MRIPWKITNKILGATIMLKVVWMMKTSVLDAPTFVVWAFPSARNMLMIHIDRRKQEVGRYKIIVGTEIELIMLDVWKLHLF